MEKSLRVKFLLCALLGAAVLVGVSCGGGVSKKAGGVQGHAEGFTLTEEGLRVVDPRAGGAGVVYRFGDSKMLSDTLVTFVAAPRRVVCLSTTYVAFMSALGLEERIVGVSSGGYVMNPVVEERLAHGLVKEVGSDMSIDYEAVVSLHPDVVLAYATSGPKPEFYERLTSLGIPVVMVGDYMERTPLAREEWVRAIGWLMGAGAKADSVHNTVAERYEDARRSAERAQGRPKVLLNLPWQETWYVPGGKTFVAEAFRDAGAEVLTAGHDDSPSSTPMGMEDVLGLALQADFWFHPGMATTLREVVEQNELFSSFPAVKRGQVWNNNLRQNAHGGNDYYESGVMAPDVILRDLLAIFHPELMPNHTFTYYRQLR